ncbi:DivIVA domain-containing protein [Spirosoma sp. BT702]|uniref:DivIVA domain-containing protein n=1 Tax=Spirosoma profusum TaxID=2771354 RepID=A0A926XXQ3_9BACT|nr:DivIVA domain-containing protein [Spirosoma profusum]MBD2702652.1 DivIVA domain-containing protein [Spirosoma profusum]
MKITPIEIRQHTFEKALRGYKPDDVDAFLISLSQEWERVTGEQKMLKMQLELAEKELNKLKEVEMTLFRTLKSAEDTSAQIAEQANRAGEQKIAEAQQKADEITAEARKKAALLVQDAENQARYLKDNIINDLKSLEHDFKALEGYKDNLALQIRTLANNAVDSVERFEKKFARQNLKGKIEEVTGQIHEEIKAENEKAAKTAKAKPVETPTEPETAEAQAEPVADLPPLTEREDSIPEAIPVDEAVVDKLDEAIEHSQEEQPQQQAIQEPIAETETSVEQHTPESELAEANTPEPEEQPKKGGSFFDQI